jgi:hypothetical protein
MTYALAAALAVTVFGLIVQMTRVRNLQGWLAESEERRMAEVFEADRLRERHQDVLVPLTWVWDEVDQSTDARDYDFVTMPKRVVKAYLTAIYTEVQKALLRDDVEMTEAVLAARETPPPRRLPTRPQVPPYLASVADVVGAPVDFERNQVAVLKEAVRPIAVLPTQDWDVVTTPKPQMPERYFTQAEFDGPWVEVDRDTAEHEASHGARTYVVNAGASPESVPEPIRALIWAPPRGEDLPEPVALDDEA